MLGERDITDDRTLMQRVQKDDLDALRIIHHRYFSPLYNYALYRVSDPMSAEDITSEVFTRLLNVLRSSKTKPRSLRKWLFGVARNVVADYQRYQYRNQSVSPEDVEEILSQDMADPVTRLENSFEIAELKNAMTKITRDQQDVIALRFGAELSIKETAKVMKKSINAVKVLQFRAIKALRNHIVTANT